MKIKSYFPCSFLLLCLWAVISITSCNKTKEIVPPPPPTYALQFDGIDGHVIFGNDESLNPTDAITISMWVRLTSLVDCDSNDNQRGLLYKGWVYELNSGYNVIINDDGALEWDIGTEGGLVIYGTGTQLILGKWTFITFVYDATTSEALIYLNAIQDISGGYGSTGHGAIITNSLDLRLNTPTITNCPTTNGNFPGSIDELSIWNIALTPQQIRDIMDNGLVGTETGLISYWPFDEGIDRIAIDVTSNNDGILFDGVKWVIH